VAALALLPSCLAAPSVHRRDIGDSATFHHVHSHSRLHRRAAGSSTYTVVSSDTGNSISAAYSITFATLSNSNPGVNWNNLQIGQNLVMPSSRTPIIYTVMSGDTETTIANKYDIYNADLGGANPSITWTNLQIGTKLRVPGYGSWTKYTVVSGDTGNAIATAEGITFNALSSANPNVNWNNLQIGQILTVPAGTSPASGTLPSPASSPISTTTTSSTTTAALVQSTKLTTSSFTTSVSLLVDILNR
jgi:LysM repeat protein